MSITNEKIKRFAANSIFPSFVYAVLGLVLTQATVAQMHVSWIIHAIVASPGIGLSGVALFRARLHWATRTLDTPGLSGRGVGGYLLLLVTGSLIGALVTTGSVLVIGVVSALTYLVPWRKIPVCRARFVAAAVVTVTGAVVWVIGYGRPVSPIHFMPALWMLFASPLFMHLLVLLPLDSSYRLQAPSLTVKRDTDVHLPILKQTD